MDTFKSFVPEIYKVNDHSFAGIALDIFRYQAKNNLLYAAFVSQLGIDPLEVRTLEEIPFLPISFFKSHTIRSEEWAEETVFTSSGTSGMEQSRHFVRFESDYLENTVRCFEHFFGSLSQYHFLALLPSYLERSGSSLIAMMKYFMERSGSDASGFFLHEHEKLLNQLASVTNSGRKVILWGVSFALLDLAAEFSTDLSNCHIFETGGMKGRRKEITRQELHLILKEKFNVPRVFSEYGMTELFSQAYTAGGFNFQCPPQMKVIGRDMSDPFLKGIQDETCGINVIDLANWRTISFIETEDIGKAFPDGSFEVLGRMDNSEMRGCNLLL